MVFSERLSVEGVVWLNSGFWGWLLHLWGERGKKGTNWLFSVVQPVGRSDRWRCSLSWGGLQGDRRPPLGKLDVGQPHGYVFTEVSIFSLADSSVVKKTFPFTFDRLSYAKITTAVGDCVYDYCGVAVVVLVVVVADVVLTYDFSGFGESGDHHTDPMPFRFVFGPSGGVWEGRRRALLGSWVGPVGPRSWYDSPGGGWVGTTSGPAVAHPRIGIRLNYKFLNFLDFFWIFQFF